MRRFAISLAALMALVFALDRGLGVALRSLFDDRRNGELDDLRAGARRMPQIAISGSSRARYHYVADSMEAQLGARVHNFGRGGQFSSIFQFVVAQLVLEETVPDVWVIEADARLYRGDDGRVSELLPYAPVNDAIRRAVSGDSPLARARNWSRIYPYNSLAPRLIAARFSPVEAVPRNGFKVRPGALERRRGTLDPLREAEMFPAIDSVRLDYLARLVSELRDHGVRVMAVRSPFYASDSVSRRLLQREGHELTEVFASLDVPFVDVAGDAYPQFVTAASFADRRHLDEEAALQFSRVIADSIAALRGRPAPPKRNDAMAEPLRVAATARLRRSLVAFAQ